MKYKRTTGHPPGNTKTHIMLSIVSVALIVVVLSGLYLRFAWNRYQQMQELEALKVAKSVESLLHVEHIAGLVSDDRTQNSNLVEQSLVRLVEATDSIYYAYILKQQNENIVVITDSSAAGTGTFSPMRLSCEETVEINRIPFETGQSVISAPISIPCGDWIRVLVPIYNPNNNNVIAVLGLSYSADQWQANLWKKITPDILIAACLFVIILTLLNLWHKHLELKEATVNLAFQEVLYRNIVEKAPIGIILQKGKEKQTEAEYISINPRGEAILGRSINDMKEITWAEITPEEDLKIELPQFERFVKGELTSYAMEKRLIRPDGTTIWVSLNVVDFSGSPFPNPMYLCLLEDISDRKQSEEVLRESERSKSVFFSNIPGMAYRCKYDGNWTMEFVSDGCYVLTGYKAESLILNRELSYNEIISPEYRDIVRVEREKALQQHKDYNHEYEIITKSGDHRWVLARGRGIYDTEGNAEALEGIILDISEQKKKEHQIAYLQEHDFPTGLYNRNHIEQEKRRLDQPEFWPLSIVICDIDGLRMINDAYGHEEGDQLIIKTAKLIQGCLRDEYILGHTGGGTFVLLLPHTDEESAHQLKTDIKNAIASYNRANKNALYAISVSIGHSQKETEEQKIQDVARVAEEYLNHCKLLNQNSSHSAIVSSIMATLYAKSQETEEHGQRLGKVCQMMGEQLGLAQNDLDDLQLLSKLHDIGKIGIDDRILNNPGKLSEDEWKIMKQHPEIGHSIAMTTPQLEHIAGYILYHHERWDGKGYPAGLKEHEIPVASRILSIADAFDAMTEDRIYRKAMSHEEAIQEIERNIGTQFDPEITKLFIKQIATRC